MRPDELTGLDRRGCAHAPDRLEGMEVKSVMKKFKDKKFAAGCSRDVIRRGAEMLGHGAVGAIGKNHRRYARMTPRLYISEIDATGTADEAIFFAVPAR